MSGTMIGSRTASVVAAHRSPFHGVKRFVRSPKGYLLIILAALAFMAAPGQDPTRVTTGMLGAVAIAAVVDVAIVRYLRGIWFFPSGALLTGMIVAMVLSPEEPWHVPVATAALAIASKYLFRTRLANLFNPAALAIVASTFLFGSGQSWWGALAYLSPLAIVVLLGLGLFIANRVNKLPMVLAFAGSYVALFTATAFLVDPARVAEIFRTPDVNAALFFAFFMLDDPPTSPVRYVDQMLFGFLVACASFAVFIRLGGIYFLPAGLLVGNVWEASRRWIEKGEGEQGNRLIGEQRAIPTP